LLEAIDSIFSMAFLKDAFGSFDFPKPIIRWNIKDLENRNLPFEGLRQQVLKKISKKPCESLSLRSKSP
jgi:hypothetical protein